MHRRPRLLLVDDDENDFTLFQAAVGKAALPLTIASASNGQHAIDYLEHLPAAEAGPDVIVLDLRMPLKDGFDFLEWRTSSRFASVPVVVFTGLGDGRERNRALALGADLVLEKPLKFGDLVHVVRTIRTLALTDSSDKTAARQPSDSSLYSAR